MADLNVKVRKWGDSLAVIIPKKVAEKERIRVEDKIHLKIERERDFSDLFGIAKGKLKKTAQQLKDESRGGWN